MYSANRFEQAYAMSSDGLSEYGGLSSGASYGRRFGAPQYLDPYMTELPGHGRGHANTFSGANFANGLGQQRYQRQMPKLGASNRTASSANTGSIEMQFTSLRKEMQLKARGSLGRFQAKVIKGEVGLAAVLSLTQVERYGIVQDRPFIDVYLGDTKLYKRAAKVLLYAFCPDIGRLITPKHGEFVVQIPHSTTKALSMKLAILYMEEYVLKPRVRQVDWKVRGDVGVYIDLANAFELLGMESEAKQLEKAILRRMREMPLRLNQVKGIWSREMWNLNSKYAMSMADNILTFSYWPEMDACTPFMRAAFDDARDPSVMQRSDSGTGDILMPTESYSSFNALGQTAGDILFDDLSEFQDDSYPFEPDYTRDLFLGHDAFAFNPYYSSVDQTFDDVSETGSSHSKMSNASSSSASSTASFGRYLNQLYNDTLKQLVMTATVLPSVPIQDPSDYLIIESFYRPFPNNGRRPGMAHHRKITLKKRGLDEDLAMEDYE